MNKEQLRKELEDCWAVACKWFEIAGGPPEKFIANRDTYINGKLAEVQNYESLAQDAIRDIDLITDFADFGAKEKLGMIEKAILKYWEDCKKPTTTRLADIDDGEYHTVSNAIGAFDESLRVAQAAFPETDFTKKDSVDDGQEGNDERKKHEGVARTFRALDVLAEQLHTTKKLLQEYKKEISDGAALPLDGGEGRNEKIKKEFSDNKEALLKGAKEVHKKMKSSAVTGGVKWVKWVKAILEQIKLRVGEKGFSKDANKQSDLYLFVSDVIAQLSEGQPE